MNKGQHANLGRYFGCRHACYAKVRFTKRERVLHRKYCREFFYGVELEDLAPSNVRIALWQTV